MGYCFSIRYANIVAYLTDSTAGAAGPRLTIREVQDFCGSLAGPDYTGESPERPTLISSNVNWIKKINGIAEETLLRGIHLPFLATLASDCPNSSFCMLLKVKNSLALFTGHVGSAFFSQDRRARIY